MKYFIFLATLILAVSAMPTEIGTEDGEMFIKMGNDTTTFNSAPGLIGFATLNGGTRGGTGGAVWTVWDAWALRDAVTGNNARIVYVRGRIDLTTMFTGSPGVVIRVGNFKTIVGGDSNAMIFGGGLRMSGVHNVIIDNIKIHNALSYAPGEQPNGNGGIISQQPGAWSTVDAVGIDNSRNVWVNHCEFADDPWNSNSVPENQRRHDGLLDITAGADFITVSNSLFRNHRFVMLVGNNDNGAATDSGRLKVTYNLNWFQGSDQRHPRVRFGQVHVLNCLYTDIPSYGIGLGVAAQVYAERNAFINTRRAWGWASGVPSTRGYLVNFNNWLQNSGHDTGITGGGVNFHPPNLYGYTAIAAGSVEAQVRRTAGTR